MFEATIPLTNLKSILPLFGPQDQHLRTIRDSLDVQVLHRDGELRIAGDENSVAQATEALVELKAYVEKHGRLAVDEVQRTLDRIRGGDKESAAAIEVLSSGKLIRARTAGQAAYVNALRKNDLVFSIGPSGSINPLTSMSHCGSRASVSIRIRLYCASGLLLPRPADADGAPKIGIL